MPKIVQNEYTKAYNKEHYKNVSIKVSPEEAEEIDTAARKIGISKARLIVNAVRLYAQSLTAASPAPEEISPETVTGAKETQAETETETPEEDQPQQDGSGAGAETPKTPKENQQGKPQDKPQDAHSKPQDNGKASKADITSKATKEPPEDAQGRTEASTSPNPEEIAEEIKAAYLKGYRQARQEIKAEIKATRQAAQQAQRIRHTAQRTRVLTQARRRPKAYKG